MEKQSYIGYHATSKQFAESIFENNFEFSKKGWFGTGVYFYLDSIELAKHWLEKKGFSEKQIIKATIKVEPEFILDVRNPYSSDVFLFHRIREKIKKSIINKDIGVKTKQKNFDNATFNYIFRKKYKKMIIGNSFTYDNDEIVCYSIVPNGTEICVGALEIIENKEVVYNE